MKINRKVLILSSLIILLPVAVGIIYWTKLPDTMATHFDFTGRANGFNSKLFTVFGLPLLLLGTHLFVVYFTSYDPKAKNISSKPALLIYWIVPLTSLFVMAAVYSSSLGFLINPMLLSGLLLGSLALGIGNYMPKIRQNYSIGIRLPWTLDDEENWNKTHRLAGKIWVICGFIIFTESFLQLFFPYILTAALAVMILVPTVYSFRLNRLKVNNEND
ncbi:SdpI family protein [Streptococcus sp. H31]|uniref:SdpI family protein n=1 Tax=Streptococcus huangxiaojuni TaxID=3237239 RepID=UPI0034A1490D